MIQDPGDVDGPNKELSENSDDSDDKLELSGDSTMPTSDGGNIGNEMTEVEAIAREDTKMLQMWRRCVALILVFTFCGVLTGAIIFLKKEQEDTAHNNYLLFAAGAGITLKRKSEEYGIAMQNLAQTITSGYRAGEQFPFVTVPSFEIIGSQARKLTRSLSISWVPLVTEHQRSEWAIFSTARKGWYKESALTYKAQEGLEDATFIHNATFRRYIWEKNTTVIETPPGPPSKYFAPLWKSSPPPYTISLCNFNLLNDSDVLHSLSHLFQQRDATVASAKTALDVLGHRNKGSHEAKVLDHPRAVHMQPVFEKPNNDRSNIVGFIMSIVTWDIFLSDMLQEKVLGIVAVLKNTCNDSHTFKLQRKSLIYLGIGDLHDVAYDYSKVTFPVDLYMKPGTIKSRNQCIYSISLYKTTEFQAGQSPTSLILICTAACSIAFLIMAVTFLMYDRFVRSRNEKMVYAAAHSNAILSTLFPTEVRDRLFGKGNGNGEKAPIPLISSQDQSNNKSTDLPVADLYLDTTVMFADIVGFTAWSSVHEPSQVFVLLETIFQTFDEIARVRRIFKVETVGDCYVAVAGLPEPRKDHAVAMAKFAMDCMTKMHLLVKKLELTLGPETGELSMRMGLNSGPVTAGVLRGDRCRFQLFGDTMNTAARMESNGMKGKIQLSAETASLLITAGKSNWISPRTDAVSVKGKGEMKTFWLVHTGSSNQHSSISDQTNSSANTDMDREPANENDVICTQGQPIDPKIRRLVQWNMDLLIRQLKQIVANRTALSGQTINKLMIAPNEDRFKYGAGYYCLDEVKEIVSLPGFSDLSNKNLTVGDTFIDEKVIKQLELYLTMIATMYRNNPFHNFEHASHVVMSVGKLLSRIVAPQNIISESSDEAASTLHDHTYGITSDPLTQFSCTLSALIHDVDHPGVPNVQLVKESCPLAQQYNNKSPAEQNSVDLAWELLMKDQFKDLRATIYKTDDELIRFRQLIVNSVMATDIADKELKVLRNMRWDRAFSSTAVDANELDTTNRKATIVIEHLIQASDVAHTMQHWHVYRKWNERFFLECYLAYKNGRAETNPADSWYEGEIGFFDFYIIPLAKKLKDCGVFGVSSDEYLNYAILNRKEWETRGKEIVHEMIAMAKENEEELTAQYERSEILHVNRSSLATRNKKEYEQVDV